MPKERLKQRADGRYRCKYDGQYFYGKTQSEAFDEREKYKQLKQAGLRAEASGVTLRQYAAKWIAIHKAGVTEKSYNSYALQLEKLIASIGNQRMQDITATDVKQAYNTVSDLSASAIHIFAVTIRGMFRSAVADRVITHDPSAGIKPPSGDSGSHRAITKEERDLIHATPHRMRSAVMVMLYAGLRRGEVMAIDIDRDVDITDKTISVREAVRYDNNQPTIADPKTEAGARTIPLLDVLVPELSGKHGLLSPSAAGKHMSSIAFRRAWDSYLTALSVKANGYTRRWRPKDDNGDPLPFRDVSIQPHDLRHSYCTMLYDAGVDLKTAMKWMGHADQTMTMRIYTHLSEEREQSAKAALAERVNIMLGGQIGGQT